MLCIVTSVHDPAALAAACRRLGLSPPEQGRFPLGGRETPGWAVRLPGLRGPVVFDTLSGLAAYDPRDNAFAPYHRIARFIYRYYDIRAVLRRGDTIVARRPQVRRRRPMRAGEVA